MLSSVPLSKEVWANSPSFDLAMLADAFDYIELKAPWKYYEERDLRTAKRLIECKFPNVAWQKNDHNALQDAKNQLWDLEVCRAAMQVPNPVEFDSEGVTE